MRNPAEDLIWITGASSGIGRALALRLAGEGKRVAASARSADDLAALVAEPGAAGRIFAYPLDVKNADDTIDTAQRIEAAHGPIGMAILSAGIFRSVSIDDWSVENYRQLVDVNILGVVHAIAGVLPGFKARNSGTIAIVSSMAQYRGMPRSAGYGATKAALLSMAETLWMQAKGTGIRVRIIVPGPVLTRMSTSTSPAHAPYQLEADEAARLILDGIGSDRFETLLPGRLVWRFKLTRWLPNWLYFWYAARTPIFGGVRR